MKNGFFGFLSGFLAPVAGFGAETYGKGTLLCSIKIPIRSKKTEEVKVFLLSHHSSSQNSGSFGSMLVGGVMDTVGQVVGKESTLVERLVGLGKIVGAITGITLLLQGVNFVRDALGLVDTVEDVADVADMLMI